MLRRLLIWSAATLGGAAAILVSFAIWAVGLGHYGEDYCALEARDRPEVSRYSGPRWTGLLTLRCTYAGHPDVNFSDPRPLLWSAGWVVVGGGAVATALWTGRRYTRRG